MINQKRTNQFVLVALLPLALEYIICYGADPFQARAGEALLKLISDLKQFCCLNDFAFINHTIAESNRSAAVEVDKIDAAIGALRDQLSGDLVDLQLEFVTGIHPTETVLPAEDEEA